MKLLFEEYPYSLEAIKRFCLPSGDELFIRTKRGNAVFNCVGYFYSSALNDAVFILPKVLIGSNEESSSPLAFGKYRPESLIDFDAVTASEEQVMPKEAEKEFIFRLAVWLYQAIDQYSIRQWQNQSVDSVPITEVLTHRNNADANLRTYLDIILQLFRFHKEHNRLFTYISLLHSGGVTRIDWNRTITKKTPLLVDGTPIYNNFLTQSKNINLEEELIVLFYSVLVYLREQYHFRVAMTLNYPLLPVHRIQAMIHTGKGTRFLRSIRRNYFKDELVALWKLLYVFFDKSERISSGRYHHERLLVRKFNVVFEDMIDKLLSDGQKVPIGLKEQRDGKLVDHIYADKSLTGPEEIFFIGDSKYYQENHVVGEHSVYKQFTYAKNVIQFNVGILDGKSEDNSSMRYRDDVTEGYNITPNFFIRGKLDFKDLTAVDDKLDIPMEQSEREHTMKQFDNRLFDRDTLLIQTYNINFLYVMNAYISRGGNEAFRKKARERFRTDILRRINDKYVFYKIDCLSQEGVTAFVDKFFRRWVGKMYRTGDQSTSVLLAFEKDKDELTDEMRAEIRQHWILRDDPITLPVDEDNAEAND